jgi:hypothetical protein
MPFAIRHSPCSQRPIDAFVWLIALSALGCTGSAADDESSGGPSQPACSPDDEARKTDPANCGGCGIACGAGDRCVDGICQCVTSRSVSFQAEVEPILAAACSAAACHGGVRPKENLSLVTGQAYAQLVNVASSQCGGQRVVPSSPSSSYLMQKLLNVDVCMGTQMPKVGESLPAGDLDTISSWICSGAPNN